MREQKYHLYISANEHSEIIKNLIRLKNKLQSEGRYTDAVDDLIIKFSPRLSVVIYETVQHTKI